MVAAAVPVAAAGHVEACTQTEATGQVHEKYVGEIPECPWQLKPYQKDNAVWQAAAQRRHMHRRFQNQSLGVASVDLSGPHEPTPFPGHRVGSSPGHYFLVLAIKLPTCKPPAAEGGGDAEADVADDPDEPVKPLYYAALLTK